MPLRGPHCSRTRRRVRAGWVVHAPGYLQEQLSKRLSTHSLLRGIGVRTVTISLLYHCNRYFGFIRVYADLSCQVDKTRTRLQLMSTSAVDALTRWGSREL